MNITYGAYSDRFQVNEIHGFGTVHFFPPQPGTVDIITEHPEYTVVRTIILPDGSYTIIAGFELYLDMWYEEVSREEHHPTMICRLQVNDRTLDKFRVFAYNRFPEYSEATLKGAFSSNETTIFSLQCCKLEPYAVVKAKCTAVVVTEEERVIPYW